MITLYLEKICLALLGSVHASSPHPGTNTRRERGDPVVRSGSWLHGPPIVPLSTPPLVGDSSEKGR